MHAKFYAVWKVTRCTFAKLANNGGNITCEIYFEPLPQVLLRRRYIHFKLEGASTASKVEGDPRSNNDTAVIRAADYLSVEMPFAIEHEALIHAETAGIVPSVPSVHVEIIIIQVTMR